MRKIILTVSLFLSFVVNANTMICPTNITCNYKEGTCDQPEGWYIYFWAADTPFTDIALSSIEGLNAFSPSAAPEGKIKKTTLSCNYLYGDHSFIRLVTYVKKLTGEQWSFSGFGKFHETCSNISDPSQCSGEK